MSFPYINAYQQFFDSSGSPLASGTIEFRDPTSNDLIDTYPTADDADAQTNANDNPLTLNASGAAASGLFLEDGVKYKVILKDSSGSTIATHDDVRCPQFTAPATTHTRGPGVGGIVLKGHAPASIIGIQSYSVSNLTVDRTYDANSTAVAELADVLGTLIQDLQEKGSL